MTTQRDATRCGRRIDIRHVLRSRNLGYVSTVRAPIDLLADVDDDVTFATPDVCRIAQVTFRQLDYWSRTGTIEPDTPARGSGTQRRWTGAQVRDVAMIGRLRDLGVSLDAIEEVLAIVRTAEGALLVIAPEFVRAVEPIDVGTAIADANGAAIVVSPDSLRLLSADHRGADRCASGRAKAPTGRRPARAPRFRP